MSLPGFFMSAPDRPSQTKEFFARQSPSKGFYFYVGVGRFTLARKEFPKFQGNIQHTCYLVVQGDLRCHD